MYILICNIYFVSLYHEIQTQWLHDNGASSIIDTIYEETPDNLKPTDYKKLTKNQQEKDIKDKIYQNQKEFINQAVETGFRSINLPGTVFDFYANQKSNGDYNTFGEMLRKGEDKGLRKYRLWIFKSRKWFWLDFFWY